MMIFQPSSTQLATFVAFLMFAIFMSQHFLVEATAEHFFAICYDQPKNWVEALFSYACSCHTWPCINCHHYAVSVVTNNAIAHFAR